MIRSILRKQILRLQIRSARPLKMIVGAGGTRYRGWIATEMTEFNLLQPESWAELLGGKKVFAILAEHVWEHLTVEQGIEAARTCLEFMDSGGRLRVAVPDGFFPQTSYIEQVRPGGSGAGAEDHKVLYNYKSFSEIFERAGFRVKLLEYFDETGKFHQSPWDETDGRISRSAVFDPRNQNGNLNYTSIILDAFKSG